MPNADLPERASLDYLRKLAKERLRALRAASPDATLSQAQLEIAREHGFPSWRALKAEVDRRNAPRVDTFFAAARAGDVPTMHAMLSAEPALANARNSEGSTPLHFAVAHPAAVKLLLERGADVNARDRGDNAYALHFAAANGYVDTVKLLLDAGADPHGFGDVHQGDVIGWAAGDPARNEEVIRLLLAHGAKHHIFSAIALGDADLVQRIVEQNPGALARRRSRFEQGQTPLHFALSSPDGLAPRPPRYDIAELLIDLGADVDATDDRGRTPMEIAMLQGDKDAMTLLAAHGAVPAGSQGAGPRARRAETSTLGDSFVRQIVPMLCVDDPDAAVDWYVSLGFTVLERWPEAGRGRVNWAYLRFGKVELMIQEKVARPRNQIALWFYTNRIEELYEMLKARQLQTASAELAGERAASEAIHFYEDLYEPHYGGKQFSIRDVNGFELVFMQTD